MEPHSRRKLWILFIGLILMLGLAYADVNIKDSGTTQNNNFWNIPSFSAITNNVYTTCTNSSTQSTYTSYTVQNSDSSAITLRVRAIFDFSSFGNAPYIAFYKHSTSYTWTLDDAQSCNFFQFASTSTAATDLFVLVEPDNTLEIYLSGPSTQNSGKYAIEVTQLQQTAVTTDSSSYWKYPTTSSCSPQSSDTVPFSKFQFDSNLCDPCDISLVSFAEMTSTNPVFGLYKASSSSFGTSVNPCVTGFVQAANSTSQIATMRNVRITATSTVLSSITGNDTAYLGLSVSPSLYGTTTTAQRTWNPPVVPQGLQQTSCSDSSSTTPFQSYSFKVNSANTYFFDTRRVSTEAPFDAALYLYSSTISGTPTCSQFVKAGDSGNGGAIVVDLAPGNYTLVVSARTGSSSGSYLLHGLSSQAVAFNLIPYTVSTTATTSGTTGIATTGQSTTGQSTTGQSTTGQSTTGAGSTTGVPSSPSAAPSASPVPSTTSSTTSAGGPSPSASPNPNTTSVTTGAGTTGQSTTGQSTTGEGTSSTTEATTESSTTLEASQSSSGGEPAVGGQLLIIIVAAVAGSAALGIIIGLILFMRRRNAKKDKKEPEDPPATDIEPVDGEYTPMEPVHRAPPVEADPQRMSETPSGSGASTSEVSSSQLKTDSEPVTSTGSSSASGSSTSRTRKETHPIYGNADLDDPNRLRFILDRDVTLCEKLGDGFFGEVYRGLWKGREVALKSFKEEDDDPTAFLNEAKLLQKLEHPNVVSFLGIFLGTNRKRYIVMEYMNGGSLQRFLLLKKNIITEIDLVEMALQAAAGMVFLESQNIVHRDLALRNLLVSSSETPSERDRKSTPRRGSLLHQDTRWVVKVADFGLSRKADPGFYTSQTRTIPVKWSAPEVLLYQTYNYTSKCDVWSFGVVLWELFSFGMTPYPALSNSETVDFIQSGARMSKPKQCPDQVYQVMLKCWEFEPETRPSFSDVYHQLHDILKEMSNTQTDTTQENITNAES